MERRWRRICALARILFRVIYYRWKESKLTFSRAACEVGSQRGLDVVFVVREIGGAEISRAEESAMAYLAGR
jgi:hypothetical protein